MSYANLDAYTDGQQAKQDGQPVQSNPWPPYQPYHDDWLEGWHSVASKKEQNRNNRHEKN